MGNIYGKCPRCGKDLETSVKRCPDCGFSYSENTTAKVIFAVGFIVIAVGVIASWVLGHAFAITPAYSYKSVYNYSLFFMGLISSASAGLLLIGISEIISLLQSIYNVTKKG